MPTRLQIIPHSPHPSPFPPAPVTASYSPPSSPSLTWELWGCPHSRHSFPSPSTTRCHWGATGRAGASSASPEGHGIAAVLPKEWWLPWGQQGQGQTRATTAMAVRDEGTEDQKDHRKVYSSGGKGQAPGGRKTCSQPSCSKQQKEPCLRGSKTRMKG